MVGMDALPASPENKESLPRWRRFGLPLAVLAAALLLVHPVLQNLSEHLLGIEEVDGYGTQWFYWVVYELWTEQGSIDLSDLQESTVVFHPYGKDIYSHTGSNLLDAFLAIPFRWMLGPVAGYNLFCLMGMVFNGWAFSCLARQFSSDILAIWVSSLWFACSPYILYEFAEGRPTQGIVGLLPLFMLYLWRSGLGPGWRSPVLSGVLLALVGLQYWFYAFFGGLAALAHGLWRSARPVGEQRGREVFMRHALMGIVALVLCAPFALPLVMSSAEGSTPGLLEVSSWSLSQIDPTTQEGTEIGILGFQPWLGQSAFMVLRSGEVQILGHQATLSGAALLLFVMWLRYPGSLHRGPVLAMVGFLGLISIGPVIMLGDGWVGNPLYIALVEAIPFTRRLWWPGRAFVIPCILIGLFGTLALHWSASHGRRVQLGLALCLSGLWAWDLRDSALLPLPTWDAKVPAGYECLSEGEEGAVIVLPFGWNQAHLYYQTRHGRPMIGGMLESNVVFTPTEAVELRRENSWLRVLLAQAEWGEGFPDSLSRAGAQLDILEERGDLSAAEQSLLELGRQALDPSTELETLESALSALVQLPDPTVDWIIQAVADSDDLEREKRARVQIGRRPWEEADRQFMHDLGYRYVVLQKDALLLPYDGGDDAQRVNRTRLRKFSQRLTNVAGASVYDDQRIAIYAPWGDPSPCVDVEIDPDLEQGPPPRKNSTASVKHLDAHSLSPLLGD
jgi:hypothetical protein